MKNNSQKRDKVLAIGITVLALVVTLGVGYAFFSASVSNTNHETVSTETATLSLKFDDGDNGVSGNLNLGESITKKFTLQNIGTLDAYAKINWYNLVNTYMNGSLAYNLEQSESEDGSYSSIGSGNVPVSSTETTEMLKNGILVPVNKTYYYKLTITFNNLNVNQNTDINATFYSYFSLEEGTNSELLTDHIKNLAKNANLTSTDVINADDVSGTCTNTLAYDGTNDNNLRYVGSEPCNYVTFNNEMWRIIGVMNNVDDGTGKKEERVKLIRGESLGYYSWDTSDSNVNGGWGVNDWTQADLMQELNGDYLDTTLQTNTMWYNERNNQKTSEYDYTKGLKAEAQSQIGNVKWYLGGQEYDVYLYGPEGEGTAAKYYEYERGIKVWGSSIGQTCNDTACPRATEWTGKIALPYPSDYGFAVGDNIRDTCLNNPVYGYNYDNCYESDWLKSYTMWTISPVSKVSTSSYRCSNILEAGNVITSQMVYPALYLKSSVSVSSGNGSPESPFTIE